MHAVQCPGCCWLCPQRHGHCANAAAPAAFGAPASITTTTASKLPSPPRCRTTWSWRHKRCSVGPPRNRPPMPSRRPAARSGGSRRCSACSTTGRTRSGVSWTVAPACASASGKHSRPAGCRRRPAADRGRGRRRGGSQASRPTHLGRSGVCPQPGRSLRRTPRHRHVRSAHVRATRARPTDPRTADDVDRVAEVCASLVRCIAYRGPGLLAPQQPRHR